MIVAGGDGGTGRRHFIVNIGMARCGTTALEAHARGLEQVASPARAKEIKYFFDPEASLEGYLACFETSAARVFLESSPPYAHLGTERCFEALDRMRRILPEAGDVTVLVCLRNLVARAFSHYWHDIGGHHAIYGSRWSVRRSDDPRRFASLYTSSFVEMLETGPTAPKYLPELGQVLEHALDLFGPGRLRIAHTLDLDAGIGALMAEVGLPGAAAARLPRIPGAQAPVYLDGGAEGRVFALEGRDGPEDIEVPAGQCLLFARRHQEVLRAEDVDLGAITGAAAQWSREVEAAQLPAVLQDYLDRQSRAVAALPESCFLGGCRTALLADMNRIPDRLRIGPIACPAGAARRLLAAAAAPAETEAEAEEQP